MRVVLCKYIFVDIPDNALDIENPASFEIDYSGIVTGEFYTTKQLKPEVLERLKKKHGDFDEIYRPL